MADSQEWFKRAEEVEKSVQSGAIEAASRDALTKYNEWLCFRGASAYFGDNYGHLGETVRLHLLRTFMEGLEQKNAKLQKLVIVLTVAALLGAAAQVALAVLAYAKPPKLEISWPSTGAPPQAPAPQLAAPCQPVSPVSCPAKAPSALPSKP